MSPIFLASIIIASVIAFLAIITFLLNLFISKVLRNDLKLIARFIVGLLSLQFILGMLANLFASIPDHQPWMVFHEFGYISAHTLNATLLLILSILFLIRVSKAKKNKRPAISGHVSILIAFASGITFVNFGQNDIFSLTMALAFLAAFGSYLYFVFSNEV